MRWLNRLNEEVKEPVHKMYADVPGIRVCVHQIYGFNGWFLDCPELGIIDINLYTEDFKVATERAKGVIDKEAKELMRLIKGFLEN